MTELPKTGPVPMDVDEKDVAKLLAQMNENVLQMNDRINNLPTKKTDFDSYMGKVNKLEGTLNVHIEAAKGDSASIHQEIKALQDRVTTIESKKGSASAPRRPTGQAASRYDSGPADVAKCERELKCLAATSRRPRLSQLSRTPSSRSTRPVTTLESLGVDVDNWISRKKRNETDVILKFKGKSLTKAAEFAIKAQRRRVLH